MTDYQAAGIATLLNKRNQLAVAYTREKVLKESSTYRWREAENGSVIACIQIKKVQWYQCEVLHLSVSEAHAGQGLGKSLLSEAERIARGEGARVIQCTIREGNKESCGLFESSGYRKIGAFHYEATGNNVWIYQKILEPSH